MNAKNGPNAMNANKFSAALLLLAGTLGVHAAQAENTTISADKDGLIQVIDKDNSTPTSAKEKPKDITSNDYLAPTLYGLHEILLQYPTFQDARASNDCGLNRETLLTVMQRNLQDPNLEVMPLNETHERRAARAELTYEIHSARLDQLCVSWINMRLSDRAAIILPPIKIPRDLTITYWQRSMAARSPVDRHQTSVGDALAAMGRQFLRDLKLAEPATYSNEMRRPEATDEELKSEKQAEMLRTINESVSHRLLNKDSGADIIMPEKNGTKPPEDMGR